MWSSSRNKDGQKMEVYTIINQKGGVGKTTSAVNIAAALNRLRKKVLIVDMDPQGSATVSTGIITKGDTKTTFEVLTGAADIESAIIKREGAPDLLACDLRLTSFKDTNDEPGKEFILKERLEEVAGFYDVVIIDTPPALSMLTLNALTACDGVIIPMVAEYLALNGVAQLLNTINTVKKRLNNKLEIKGVFLTRYDKRKIIGQEIAANLQEFFKDAFCKTYIRENVAVTESQSAGQDVINFNPECNAAADYMELTKEIFKI